MLAKFRSYYPQASLISELIDIDRGLYLVKASVQVDGVILATGLAGADRIETAEDSARERAISALVLDNPLIQVEQKMPETDRDSNLVKFSEAKTKKISQPDIEPNIVSQTANSFPSSPQPLDRPIGAASSPSLPRQEADESEISPIDFPVQKSASLLSETLIAQTTDIDSNQASSDRKLEISSANPNDAESVNGQAAINFKGSEPVDLAVNIKTINDEIDFYKIKQQTDIEITRLGWTQDDGRDFLKSRYGKTSRVHLTDDQLLEFLEYLKGLPSPNKN